MDSYTYTHVCFDLRPDEKTDSADSDFKIIVINQLDSNYQKKKLDFFVRLWFSVVKGKEQ